MTESQHRWTIYIRMIVCFGVKSKICFESRKRKFVYITLTGKWVPKPFKPNRIQQRAEMTFLRPRFVSAYVLTNR